MAHYDFYNFGTSTCSLNDREVNASFRSFPQLNLNYFLSYKEGYNSYAEYLKHNLTHNIVCNLKTAARWASKAPYRNYIGYYEDFSSAYRGSSYDIQQYLADYCKSIHPLANTVNIYSWYITVNDYSKALYCYLFKHYYSLVIQNTYSESFNESTGEITVIFNDSSNTKITIKTSKVTLKTGSFIYYVTNQDIFSVEYNNNKTPVVVTFDTVYSYQTKDESFRLDYSRQDSTDNFIISPATTLYICYSYTAINPDNSITTNYDSIIYVADQSKPLLDQAIYKQSTIYYNSSSIPAPYVPIKRLGQYIPTNSTTYSLCSKYMKKFLSAKNQYENLYKACKNSGTSNEFIIQNYYILSGVPLNSNMPYVKQYLFKYFDYLYNKFLTIKGLSSEDLVDKWNDRQNSLFKLNGYVTWYSYSNITSRSMVWQGMFKRTKTGIIKSGVKVGDYTVELGILNVSQSPTVFAKHKLLHPSPYGDNEETVRARICLSFPTVVFSHQLSTNSYEEITVVGLTMVNPVGFWGSNYSPEAAIELYAKDLESIDLEYASSEVLDYEYELQEVCDSDSHKCHTELVKVPVYALYYDNLEQALGLAFSASSVYYGPQNIYQNVVINVQLGYQCELKPEISDDDSGFIIPISLNMLSKMSLIKMNDILTRNLFIVTEYFQWDREHYKSWKKWIAIVLKIIVVISVIIVIIVSWGTATKPALMGGTAAFAAIDILAAIFFKIIISVVIAIVIKIVAKAIFGDSFLGTLIQIAATIYAYYACPYLALGATSTLTQVAVVASTAMNSLADYYNNKIQNTLDQLNDINQQMNDYSTKMESKFNLVNQRYQALYANQFFDFVSYYEHNHIKSTLDTINMGVLTIDSSTDILIDLHTYYYNLLIENPIDLSPSIDIQSYQLEV